MGSQLPLCALLLALAGCAASAGGSGTDAALPSDGSGNAPSDASSQPDAAQPADASTLADGGAPGIDAGLDASTTGLGHAFGTHGGYAPGVLFPSNHPQADLDSATSGFYDQWKQRYLEPGCVADQTRVKTTPATSARSVSEGHGYGMLITAIMAGHDPDARTLFDGLVRYYDAHRSTGNGALMAWAQNAACADIDGTDSATDGDLDIAYALLLADRQWGSATGIDYRTKALAIIAGILASDIHPQDSILVGDWASEPSDSHYTGTRPSDFMVSHFKAFRSASGVARWDSVVQKTYDVISSLQAGYAPSTGLLPDFAVGAPGATPSPAPANWLEGADDGRYAWNACRTPWRIATDFVMSGDSRSRGAMRPVNAWIRTRTGENPARIRDGYALDGTVLGSAQELAFVAPFAVSAMIEPAVGSNGPWLDALWDQVATAGASDYYGDSIKLLSMIVVSGNWWTP